jgi:hypothetical protein
VVKAVLTAKLRYLQRYLALFSLAPIFRNFPAPVKPNSQKCDGAERYAGNK